MDYRQVLIDAYKAVREIAAADVTPENAAIECDQIGDGILRLLHEVDPGTYHECICWEVGESCPAT